MLSTEEACTYFQKGGHSATEKNNNINTHIFGVRNVTETLTPKTDNIEQKKTTAMERSVMNYWGGGGLELVLRAQPHPQFLKWYNTFSWLYGSNDDPLTRQCRIHHGKQINHVLIL